MLRTTTAGGSTTCKFLVVVSSSSVFFCCAATCELVSSRFFLDRCASTACGGGATRPAWVKAAQSARVLLTPKHHVGGHHVAPHGINFGIVNGWSNATLNNFLRHDTPSVATLLWLWGFLSLFDVALIERCVAPSEAMVGRLSEIATETARAFFVGSV